MINRILNNGGSTKPQHTLLKDSCCELVNVAVLSDAR